MGRVFANGLGDWGLIPGRVILKTTQKWNLMPLCFRLDIIRYVSKVKWSNPGKGVARSLTPRCSSYWKGSLPVTLDYTRQLFLYIYCHPQTDCFVVSQLFSVARHLGRSKLGSKPAQRYVRLSFRPLGQQACHVSFGNYNVLCSNFSSSVRFFTFYTLPDARVLDSFKELWIMRAVAVNSFARVLNPHGGAYILSSIYIYIG